MFVQLSGEITYVLQVGKDRDGEDVFVWLSDEITYKLWVGKGRDGRGVFVQLFNEITYQLRVGKGRGMVRMCLCSDSMRLRTTCRWAKAARR